MVMKWDQKAALASVKDTFAGKDDILKQSYDRLIPVLEKKREEIKAAGPNVSSLGTPGQVVDVVNVALTTFSVYSYMRIPGGC